MGSEHDMSSDGPAAERGGAAGIVRNRGVAARQSRRTVARGDKREGAQRKGQNEATQSTTDQHKTSGPRRFVAASSFFHY